MPFLQIKKSPQKYVVFRFVNFFILLANFFLLVFCTNMQNKVQNVSFKSNIRFVSNKDYLGMVRKLSPEGIDTAYDASGLPIVQKAGEANGITYCLAGLVKNATKKINLFFNLFPSLLFKASGHEEDTLTEIGKKISSIRKNDQIKGFIIGGVSEKNDKEINKSGFNLLKSLKKRFIQDEQSKITWFFGQKTENEELGLAKSAFIHDCITDTNYVNCQKFVPKKNETDMKDLLDKQEIKNNFESIHIADDDHVYMGLDSKEEIDRAFFNQ